MQQTSSKALLQTLESADIIQAEDEAIELSEHFRNELEEEIDVDQYNGPPIESVNGVDERDKAYRKRLQRVIMAVEEYNLGLTEDELVAAGISLMELAWGSPDDDWMVTAGGEEFARLVESGENVLALISKDGCDSCESVQSKLETLYEVSSLPSGLIVVAVPGPDHRYLLHEEFDVVGAPTLLFCKDSRVEMRLTGDVHIEQIENDVERIYGY
jgi:hypothetical protein